MILSKLFSVSKRAKKLKYEQGFEDGFQAGFNKAWDMGLPYMQDGFNKIKERIENDSKMQVLKDLQPVLRGKDGTHTK